MKLQRATFAAAVAAVFGQPASWLPDIQLSNKLYTTDDSTVNSNNMPEIGNGFIATQMMTDSIWVSGVFNGYLTSDPSHRARVPSGLGAIAVQPPGTTSDAALDVFQATYFRRSYLDPSPNCTASSRTSCTTSATRIYIEQRFYAHRLLPSIMAMEVEVLGADDTDVDTEAGVGSSFAAATGRGVGSANSPIAYLKLSPVSSGPSSDVNFTAVAGADPSQVLNLGWTQTAETNTSGLTAVAILATNLTCGTTPSGLWPVDGPGTTYVWLTVIRTSIETPSAQLVTAVQQDYATALAYAANGTLHSSHVAEWEGSVWAGGLEIDRPDMAQAINASLYAVLSSARTDRPFGLSPGGLTPGYNGHTFWDQETWMFPAMSLTHPDVSASLLQYRYDRLPGAYAKATSYSPPYSGAMFPWESAFTGAETCPSWAPTGAREIHISGDIAFAVWSFWRVTQDGGPDGAAWLNATAWPLLSGIADFWVSKALADTPGAVVRGWRGGVPPTSSSSTSSFGASTGAQAVADSTPLHICDVIPPDEYADHVCDSVYTNAVAILSLQYAALAAQATGQPPAVYQPWLDASSRIPLLYNSTAPGLTGGMHPEYAGYFNVTIKQADAILLGFPLGVYGSLGSQEPWAGSGNLTQASRLNDLLWYTKVTDYNGPAMTWGMFTIGYIEAQQWDLAAFNLNRSFANVQPPFKVWTETPTGGCANFLTGAGGFLQTAYFGYPGLRFNDTSSSFSLHPLLPPQSTIVKVRGVAFLGNRLDIAYDGASITVVLQDASEGQDWTARTLRAYAKRYDVRWHGGMRSTEAKTDLSLAPPAAWTTAARSQYGKVVLPVYAQDEATGVSVVRDYWVVAPRQLVLVDAAGTSHALTAGSPVTLPLQDVTVAAVVPV